MDDNTDKAREQIVEDLGVVYGSLQQLNAPTWLKLDLTMAQLKALVAISHQPGVSVCELARHVSVGESAASLMVDQLVRRGQVERITDPDDRRRVRLSVTERGRRLLGELREGSRHVLDQWLRNLDARQRQALALGIEALATAAKESVAGMATVASAAQENERGLAR